MKFKVDRSDKFWDVPVFKGENGQCIAFSLGKREQDSPYRWEVNTSDTGMSIFDPEDFIRWVEKQDFEFGELTVYRMEWWLDWEEAIKERYNFEQGAIGLCDDNGNQIYSDSKVEYSIPNVDIAEVRVEPATDLPGDILYRVEGERSWRTMSYIGKRTGSLKVVKSHMYEGD